MGQLGGGGADAQVNNMLKVDLKESMDATGSTHFSGLFNVDDDSKSAVSAFKGSAKQPFVIGKLVWIWQRDMQSAGSSSVVTRWWFLHMCGVDK